MNKKNIFEMDGAQTRFYKKNGLMFKCSEMFKKIDMFSIPVTLRFKGERNFQTKMGAFTSFVIILAALTIFILNFMVKNAFQKHISLNVLQFYFWEGKKNAT